MKLVIKTTPDKYFHQLIEILKIFPPLNKLRKRQREVFAEILYYNHKFSIESPEVVNRLLFDYKTKDEIATKLGISKANLYNIYKELREFELLIKDEINSKFKYIYMQHSNITFIFEDSNPQKT